MLRRGAALLSDDTVALEIREGALIAHPGAGVLHLRADEHDRLSTDERAALGSQARSSTSSATTPPSPPHRRRSGAVPARAHLACPPIERIETVDPFELLAGTFNLSVRTRSVSSAISTWQSR